MHDEAGERKRPTRQAARQETAQSPDALPDNDVGPTEAISSSSRDARLLRQSVCLLDQCADQKCSISRLSCLTFRRLICRMSRSIFTRMLPACLLPCAAACRLRQRHAVAHLRQSVGPELCRGTRSNTSVWARGAAPLPSAEITSEPLVDSTTPHERIEQMTRDSSGSSGSDLRRAALARLPSPRQPVYPGLWIPGRQAAAATPGAGLRPYSAKHFATRR